MLCTISTRDRVTRGALKYLNSTPVMGGAVVVSLAMVIVVWIALEPSPHHHEIAHMLQEHDRKFDLERRLILLESRIERLETMLPALPRGGSPYDDQRRNHP